MNNNNNNNNNSNNNNNNNINDNKAINNTEVIMVTSIFMVMLLIFEHVCGGGVWTSSENPPEVQEGNPTSVRNAKRSEAKRLSELRHFPRVKTVSQPQLYLLTRPL